MTTTPPPHPAAAAAAAHPAPPWHLAGALVALKAGIDAHWPGRDKRSDGGIGDAAHQAEGAGSDHNPWLNNTVRAYDFTATQPGVTGVDGPWLAECLRLAGAAGDHRLAGHTGDPNDNGYVIWDRHITAPDFSRWVPYDGPDQHTTHVHLSVTRNRAGYEDAGSWAFLTQQPDHPTPPAGHDATGDGDAFRAQVGDQGPRIEHLQHALNTYAPAYSHLAEDGIYGPQTAHVLAEYAERESHEADTPDADRQGLHDADGQNVGPRLAHALHHDGLI